MLSVSLFAIEDIETLAMTLLTYFEAFAGCFTGAPQAGQVFWPFATGFPHDWQVSVLVLHGRQKMGVSFSPDPSQ